MSAFLGALLLMQAAVTSAPGAGTLYDDAAQDSTVAARLRVRLEGQREMRVRVDPGWVQLTRPSLGDAGLVYHEAWFDRPELSDTLLPNPLPLDLIAVAQVRGKRFSVPAVVLGGLAVGASVLASALLSKAIDSRNAPDNRIIIRGSLIGFGVGAAAGGVQGVLTTRWVTVYRR